MDGKCSYMFLAPSKAFLTDAGQFWALIRQAWPCPSLSVVPRPAPGSDRVCWDGCSAPGRPLILASPISGWMCFHSLLSPKTTLTLAFHKAAPHQTQRVPLVAPTASAHLCILLSQLKQLWVCSAQVSAALVCAADGFVTTQTNTHIPGTQQLFPVLSSPISHSDVPSMIPVRKAPGEQRYKATWILVLLTSNKCPPTLLPGHRGSFSPSLHTYRLTAVQAVCAEYICMEFAGLNCWQVY